MKDRRTTSSTCAPHPTDIIDSLQANEALRRVVAGQIGPRRPGVVYDNTDGIFLVIDVQTDSARARQMLNRRAAQFAIVAINLVTDHMVILGSVWTSSDRVIESGSPAIPPKAAAERCIFCEQWFCPGNCQQFAPAPTASLVKAVAL